MDVSNNNLIMSFLKLKPVQLMDSKKKLKTLKLDIRKHTGETTSNNEKKLDGNDVIFLSKVESLLLSAFKGI